VTGDFENLQKGFGCTDKSQRLLSTHSMEVRLGLAGVGRVLIANKVFDMHKTYLEEVVIERLPNIHYAFLNPVIILAEESARRSKPNPKERRE
jgi:hypothetical protein